MDQHGDTRYGGEIPLYVEHVITVADVLPAEGRERAGKLAIDDRYLYLPVLSIGATPYTGAVHNLEVAGAGTYVSSLATVHNCIVNGPGEMADADYGYVGKAGGMITLYRKKESIKTVAQEHGVEELVALIKADGMWREPGATAMAQDGSTAGGLNEAQQTVADELPTRVMP